MSDNSEIALDNQNDFIQVRGVGAFVTSYIVQQLTKSLADTAGTGVTSVVIAFERAKVDISIKRRNFQVKYRIELREGIYGLFNDAMLRVENNPNLRPELKQIIVDDLRQELDKVILQIQQEIQKDDILSQFRRRFQIYNFKKLKKRLETLIGNKITNNPSSSTVDSIKVSDLIEILLSDNDAEVRSTAALALGKTGDEEAVPALCHALNVDRSPEVRRSAAQALGMLGGE